MAAIDGVLLRTITPPKNAVGNLKTFFSGHYCTYGLNILAACDSHCWFVYVACKVPGGSNNISAYRHYAMPNYVENLPLLKSYIVGDNSYVPSEHLLTPFSGNDKLDLRHDSYNYYLSQLHMHIEMFFGRLVNKFREFLKPLYIAILKMHEYYFLLRPSFTIKFRIFKAPLHCSIENASRLFLAATHLHNYCINEGEAVNEPDPNNPPTLPPAYYYNQRRGNYFRGQSIMRQLLVQVIAQKGLWRLEHNVRCNNY